MSTGKRKSTNQCSSNLNTSSTSRLKYAAIRSINSADGARSPRSTLLIVFVLILDQPEGMCDTVHSASENDTANQTDSRNSCYGYHMSDEDFYIYITSHAY